MSVSQRAEEVCARSCALRVSGRKLLADSHALRLSTGRPRGASGASWENALGGTNVSILPGDDGLVGPIPDTLPGEKALVRPAKAILSVREHVGDAVPPFLPREREPE
jgi:hypothetical protein